MLKNLKQEGDTVSFNIINDGSIDISLVNGLRRALTSNIPVYIVDPENVKVHRNTSMINNDILISRLCLVPFLFNNVSKYDHDNLELSFEFKNEEEAMHSVYLRDFVVMDKSVNKRVKPEEVFPFPDILFSKLAHGQELHMVAYLTKGDAKEFGATAIPVSNVHYGFEQDEKQVKEELKKIDDEFLEKTGAQLEQIYTAEYTELATPEEVEELKKKIEKDLEVERDRVKSNFMLVDAHRFYKKNKKGQPEVYNFSLESVGIFEPKELLRLGFQALNDILEKFVYSLQNDFVDTVQIGRSESNMDVYDIVIHREDSTLGNLVKNYMYEMDEVKYVGYHIPHPLDPIVIIKVELHKDNTVENVKKVVTECVNSIKKLVTKLEKQVK